MKSRATGENHSTSSVSQVAKEPLRTSATRPNGSPGSAADAKYGATSERALRHPTVASTGGGGGSDGGRRPLSVSSVYLEPPNDSRTIVDAPHGLSPQIAVPVLNAVQETIKLFDSLQRPKSSQSVFAILLLPIRNSFLSRFSNIIDLIKVHPMKIVMHVLILSK